MTNPYPFKVLFCFENDKQLIIEVKRTDIQSEDKSLVYKWLKIQKHNENGDKIFVLTFQSMESSGENQTRRFAEGTLTWNAEQVRFNEEILRWVEPSDLLTEALEPIAVFLGTN
jgi:hypothetical protein